MSVEIVDPPDQQSVTKLVSGILSDAQDLVKQQFALVRAEVQADATRAKEAGTMFVAGIAAAAAAAVLLMLAAAYVLHEEAGMKVWTSLVSVGGAMALVAGLFVWLGVQRWNSFTLMPDKSIQAAKENLRWMANPK